MLTIRDRRERDKAAEEEGIYFAGRLSVPSLIFALSVD